MWTGLSEYIKAAKCSSLTGNSLLNKRNNVHNKSREAANDASKADRRAKAAFHDVINNTLRNPSLSAIFFSICLH